MSFNSALANSIKRKPWLANIVKRVYKSRTLNNWPPFQKWILARCAVLDARMHSTPQSVTLETVLTCNAKCKMCAHSEKRMAGEMSMELFEKLCAEIKNMGLGHVSLSLYGEPFTDKHWMDRIRHIRQRNLTYDFFTNGSLLRQEQYEEMFALGGWKYVNFSINGFTPKVYEQLTPPLKRDVVYKKVEMFLKRKLLLENSYPTTSISCVQTKENFDERSDFLKYWKSKDGVDFVVFADCSDWLSEVENISAENRNKYLPMNTWLPPCRSIWENVYVYYDGRVAPCCMDPVGRNLIIGNANRETLSEIFMGDPLVKVRTMRKNNRRSNHSVCGRCRVASQWLMN